MNTLLECDKGSVWSLSLVSARHQGGFRMGAGHQESQPLDERVPGLRRGSGGLQVEVNHAANDLTNHVAVMGPR